MVVISHSCFYGGGFVIAATEWNTAKTMFHNSEDVKITIDDLDYSLQEALDEGLIGGGMSFGDWVDVSTEAKTQLEQGPVSADGILVVGSVGGTSGINIYTGGTSGSLFKVTHENSNGAVSLGSPIKKGDYWKITGNNLDKIYWIPIVSGGESGRISSSYIRTCTTNGCVVSCDGSDIRSGCNIDSGGGAHNNDLDMSYPNGVNGCKCDIYGSGTCYAICLA